MGFRYVIGLFVRSASLITKVSSSSLLSHPTTDFKPLKILCSMKMGPTPSTVMSSMYLSLMNGFRSPTSILSRTTMYSIALYSCGVTMMRPSGVWGTLARIAVVWGFVLAVRSLFRNPFSFAPSPFWSCFPGNAGRASPGFRT